MNTCFEYELNKNVDGERIIKIKLYNKTIDLIQKKAMK
jgi:hypothetical protein